MPIADNLKFIAEIEHQGTIAAGGSSSKNIRNVYHFRRTNIAGLWDNPGIGVAFAAAMVPTVTAALNVGFTGTQVTVRCINDAMDLPVGTVDVTAGAIAGDRLPDFSAAVLVLKSLYRGSSYRGRKHFAPMSESDIGGDILGAPATARMVAIGVALLAGFTDGNGNVFVPCIYSRELSYSLTNPTNIVTSDVAQVLTNRSLGTMKHRRPPTVR